MLTDLVQTYLRTRRAMGFELDESGRLLGLYARFADARGESHVRAETAVEWAAAAATAGGRFHRLLCVRVFARYAQGEDPRHEVPSQKVFPRPPRQRMPIIYTPDEARRLVAAAGRLTPIGSLRAHAFSTLIALLFATGLRISEALALRFDDVTRAGLVIRQTKFRKTRLVPLHETAQAGLERYLVRRRRAVAHDDHVFINFRGEPLGHRGTNAMFREALRAAGIERPRGQSAPRIHDIRHTFAVRALEACPDGRDRIAQHMLALSTYLGHTHVADTYWYLQVTPRLMRDIADACEAASGNGGQP